MERGLRSVLLFFVAFPLFGGTGMLALFLVASLFLPFTLIFAVLAIPFAYAMAYGAAALAGIAFAVLSEAFAFLEAPKWRIGLGAACGCGAVWLDFPTGAQLAMPVLGAASGALCGHLTGQVSTSNRSLRELLAHPSGIAMLVCAVTIACLLAWRIVHFYVVT